MWCSSVCQTCQTNSIPSLVFLHLYWWIKNLYTGAGGIAFFRNRHLQGCFLRLLSHPLNPGAHWVWVGWVRDGPHGGRSSVLILHLLCFPGDRMRNKISSTDSSVCYWFLEWLCPSEPQVLSTIHLATGTFREAIFCTDIIGHWHRNDRNHCHTAEAFPFLFPLGQTVLPWSPQSSAAGYCPWNTLLTQT